MISMRSLAEADLLEGLAQRRGLRAGIGRIDGPPGKATWPEWLRSFSARLVKQHRRLAAAIDDRDQHRRVAQRLAQDQVADGRD